ncbi:amino acid permease [Patescibacteria group bacterium]|nr:amino acid permease [Patescibacteria group bacterium]
MNNSFVLALSTLVGTIVGAGIFGLPYVISKSGVLPAVFYFLLIGGAVMVLHLLLGEICLRTNEKHRLIGYSQMYLGGVGKMIVVVSTFFGLIGALLVYIILGGRFLAIALTPFFSLSDTTASFLFWIVLSFFVLQGIQLIARAEFFMNLLLLLFGAVIFTFALPHVQSTNFTFIDRNNIFLPYGVILFSLFGWAAIPEIADLFKSKKDKRNLDNVIVWTFAIVIAFYLAFSFIIVGVSGQNTSPNTLDGLVPFLGQNIVIVGSLFGLVALASSFLILGNYLKNSLRYDFKLPYLVSAGIAVFIPFVVYFAGIRDVISVMGILGAVLGAVEGVIIILIFKRAKKKGKRTPEYSLRFPKILLVSVMIILVLGAAAEIFI